MFRSRLLMAGLLGLMIVPLVGCAGRRSCCRPASSSYRPPFAVSAPPMAVGAPSCNSCQTSNSPPPTVLLPQ